ncbi:amidohydrolase family protein [Paraflavitalea pollutisoli]|uniref:amidohydrolase family protein n=1 Tax=Paraflavitalea pollutisoli TaxID=3034143 RepID=UPI0023ED2396|nr:amidohydrolase family protein [Paraflavitalea sp. H1-2-19X]
MQYKALDEAQQQRFDPMISGFNPTDMYAVRHIERVLRTFPGVFTGVGEFSVHREFVSSKVSGEVASLSNPALDSILDFAGKVGLIVILHNDMDMPMASGKQQPVYLAEMKSLLKRHPETTIIWAHIGLGRVVRPVGNRQYPNQPASSHIEVVHDMLKDPAFAHVYFDISWDEVAKYIVASPSSLVASADLMKKFPDRFLFGTDAVSPPDQVFYRALYETYHELWKELDAVSSEKIRKGNYLRLFDRARQKGSSQKVGVSGVDFG